jgi:Co/Zn/Cd efflux system component
MRAFNLAMRLIEASAGLWIGSAALLADAGDFLEDAAVLTLALVGHRLVGAAGPRQPWRRVSPWPESGSRPSFRSSCGF